MANNEELGKLSPEQVQKLANTISDAKNLTSQQEEIIKKVLKGETKIGELRISYLDQYFDHYSKRLDEIVARKTSELGDAFLILDKKINEDFNKFSSNLAEFSNDVSRTKTSKKNTDASSGGIEQYTDTHSRAGVKTLEDLRLSYLDKLVDLEKQNAKRQLALEFAKSKQEEDLWLRSTDFVLNKVKEVTEAELKAQQRLNGLDTEAAYASTASGAAELGSYRTNYVNAIEEEKSLSKIKEQLDEKRIQLEYKARAANNGVLLEADAAAIEKQLSDEFLQKKENLSNITAERLADEIRIKNLEQLKKDDPALAAERDARITKEIADLERKYREENNNQLNEQARKDIKKQVEEKYLSESDAMDKLVKEYAAKMNASRLKEYDPTLAAAYDAKRAERKRILELEAMRRNNGLITEAELKSIDEQLEHEFEVRTELSEELSKARLIEAELANLKENDPGISAEVDARMAKEIADLEYQYRLENNKALDKQTREAIKQQVQEKYLSESAAIEELAKEYAEKMKIDRFKENDPVVARKREESIAKDKARLELAARKRNNNILTEEDNKRIKEQLEKKYALESKEVEKLAKKAVIEQRKENRHQFDTLISSPLNKENNLIDRLIDIKDATNAKTEYGTLGEKMLAWTDTAIVAISDLAKQLELSVDKIASYKGDIDTRLQGSKNETSSGSYWNQLTKDMMSVGAVTPYFKQEKFAENIKSLVDQGIAFDLKQRAFLMTIQEKIATTFDVADGTLLRLIRIQQEDSTAGRLGMESALNSFLNNMYENTEYLKTVAAGVRSSLQEMEALMSGAEATEVEYQVQKWMGSLYSVGMSQDAVNSIASALGQLAAGQVDALTNGSGTGNLLVMAANEAGKSISDILTKGLTATETNELLQATVNYLAELAEASKDSRVVQQQLASVFGVKASDLRAATNLASDNTIDNVYSKYLTYDNMLNQLNKMAGTMDKRTSLGEMMTNVWANGQYTLASSMSNNPAAYLMYKMASLLDSTTGGIALPFISAAGFGVDLETTVADLMRVASISTGVIGSIGDMISGLSNSFSGQAMLTAMGIKKGSALAITPRGTGDGISASDTAGGGQQTTSSSGYVGNAEASDIKNSTIQEAEDSKKQQMIEALEEEQAHQIDYINENVLKIYELLDEVANGKKSLSVKVTSYGLTSLGSNTSLSGAQGGVSGLTNNTTNGAVGNTLGSGLGESISGGSFANGSSSGHSSNAVNSGSSGSSSGYGIGTGLDLGGWTMM